MTYQVTEQDINKIVKSFPNPKVILPQSRAEDQMKTYLMKYFKLYKEPKKDN